MLQTLADLQEERFVLIQYLNAKARTEDWHGVADAAMDLRELDVKLKYESTMRVAEDIQSPSLHDFTKHYKGDGQ